MRSLDPLQIIDMVRYAYDEDSKRDYGVLISYTQAWSDVTRYATQCQYQIPLIVEFILERKAAVSEYNNSPILQNGWVDSRTEDLPRYYEMLLKIFSGPLEEMPPLMGERLPYIKACATWRLKKGK